MTTTKCQSRNVPQMWSRESPGAVDKIAAPAPAPGRSRVRACTPPSCGADGTGRPRDRAATGYRGNGRSAQGAVWQRVGSGAGPLLRHGRRIGLRLDLGLRSPGRAEEKDTQVVPRRSTAILGSGSKPRSGCRMRLPRQLRGAAVFGLALPRPAAHRRARGRCVGAPSTHADPGSRIPWFACGLVARSFPEITGDRWTDASE